MNKVSHQREKRIKQLENEKLDKIAAEVDKFHNGAKAFAALKKLKDVEARQEVVVHDEKGNEIGDTAAAAARIATHFGNLFNAPETMPILSFEGEPRPLHKSIEAEEVEKAIKKLKNRKAVGPDELPTESLKAAGTCCFSEGESNI